MKLKSLLIYNPKRMEETEMDEKTMKKLSKLIARKNELDISIEKTQREIRETRLDLVKQTNERLSVMQEIHTIEQEETNRQERKGKFDY